MDSFEEEKVIRSFLMSDRAISLLRQSLIDRIRTVVREHGYKKRHVVAEVDDMRILLRILNGATDYPTIFGVEEDSEWDKLLEDVDITGI